MCENDKKRMQELKWKQQTSKGNTLFHLVFDCRWFSRNNNEVREAKRPLAQISGVQFDLKDISTVKNHQTKHAVIWLQWGDTNYSAILNFLMLQIKDALVHPVFLCWGVLAGCMGRCSEKL